ncbi:helix-turn-helix domain-containing protein [Vagococcus sp.]|uniref:helix-turn-helix domain-containing protein n=1 Tax=Vagococcus sp. TaxID=1933889 RepID=UPI003F9C2988
MNSIGEVIETRRVNFAEMTLTELANKTGVSQPYLSMIENNKKIPSYKTLFKIIEELAKKESLIFTSPEIVDEDGMLEIGELHQAKDIVYELLNSISNELLTTERVPSENLNDKELKLFHILDDYFNQFKNGNIMYPSEYVNNPIGNSEQTRNINSLIYTSNFSLDLELLFYDDINKNLKLTLDSSPLSNDEKEMIKNTLNGIRYSRLNQ